MTSIKRLHGQGVDELGLSRGPGAQVLVREAGTQGRVSVPGAGRKGQEKPVWKGHMQLARKGTPSTQEGSTDIAPTSHWATQQPLFLPRSLGEARGSVLPGCSGGEHVLLRGGSPQRPGSAGHWLQYHGLHRNSTTVH